MRSSSAVVADLVLLVVDIIEQIRPQTLEVIEKAKHLSIPLVVALNKVDKMLSPHEISLISGNSLDSVMSDTTHPLRIRIESISHQLAQHQSHVFDTVPISAKEHLNLSELLFSVDVATGMMNPTSPRDVPAQGVVLDSNADYWTMIIHCGVLRVGHFICGNRVTGTIRKITNGGSDVQCLEPGQGGAVYLNYIKYPSTNMLPTAGEVVFVMNKSRAAKRLVLCLCDLLH